MSSPEQSVMEALLDGDDARRSDAMRRLNDNRGERLMMLALANACQLQFPDGASVDEIAEYVKKLYAQHPPSANLKIVPTEYAIRAVLNEPAVLRGIAAADLLAAQIAVVGAVVEEHRVFGIARGEFIAKTIKSVDW